MACKPLSSHGNDITPTRIHTVRYKKKEGGNGYEIKNGAARVDV